MNTQKLSALLCANPYPGRGIVLGRHSDGERAVIAYFIMGRSENSRNRVFVTDGDGIRTEAFEPAKLTDPSLIIYAPVRVFLSEAAPVTIVTNGDQTDTIYDAFAKEKTFEQALFTRTFEPDAPNFTPRISGTLEGFSYKLSILKSADGNAQSVRRFYYEYPQPLAGQGHLLHTYRCDGAPIPSFEGEPVPAQIAGELDSFTEALWQSLNSENKVALFTRFIHVKTGETESRIINKNG